MGEEQVENEQKPWLTETGGLSFAVTLLAALGSISYAGYNYLQKTPVDIYLYVFFCVLIPPALFLVIGLLLYVFFKGYSLEVSRSKQRKPLNDISSFIYRIFLSIFAMLLIFILYVFVLVLVLPKIESFTVFIILIFIGVVLSLLVYWLLTKTSLVEAKSRWNTYITPGATVLLLGLLFWSAIFPSVIDLTPLQGHVTVNMDSIYCKNDAPIPVLIRVTGPNTDLSIKLSQEESNHNLREIDNITLRAERNADKIVYGKNSSLFGNTLDYGTYTVFISTTNLSSGYYELRCERSKYEKTYGARGFYLVNSSEKLFYGELNAS